MFSQNIEEASFNSLPQEVHLHMLSFLTESDIRSMTSVNHYSKSLGHEIYKKIFAQEFGINFPATLKRAKTIYFNLHRERELFVLFASANGYTTLKDYIICIVYSDSLDEFKFSAIKELVEEGKEPYEKLNNDAKIFNELIKNPEAFVLSSLIFYMKELCRVNAHETINMIYKLHPNLLLNVTDLLSEAIGTLHIPTVDTLLELGADIYAYFRHSNYSDDGFQAYLPPLLYALMLPRDNSCITNIYGWTLQYDNIRLCEMIKFLISKGANPAQNCIRTRPTYVDFKSAIIKEEADFNCITFATLVLNDLESKKLTLSEDYMNLLNELANWQPMQIVTSTDGHKRKREEDIEEVSNKKRKTQVSEKQVVVPRDVSSSSYLPPELFNIIIEFAIGNNFNMGLTLRLLSHSTQDFINTLPIAYLKIEKERLSHNLSFFAKNNMGKELKEEDMFKTIALLKTNLDQAASDILPDVSQMGITNSHSQYFPLVKFLDSAVSERAFELLHKLFETIKLYPKISTDFLTDYCLDKAMSYDANAFSRLMKVLNVDINYKIRFWFNGDDFGNYKLTESGLLLDRAFRHRNLDLTAFLIGQSAPLENLESLTNFVKDICNHFDEESSKILLQGLDTKAGTQEKRHSLTKKM